MTLWRPDTCDCEFEFDGSLTDYNPTSVIKCFIHASMSDVEAFKHAHKAVNVLKNRWHAAINPNPQKGDPIPSKDTPELRQALDEAFGAHKLLVFYSFDAEGNIEVSAPNMTQQERMAVGSALLADPVVQEIRQQYPNIKVTLKSDT